MGVCVKFQDLGQDLRLEVLRMHMQRPINIQPYDLINLLVLVPVQPRRQLVEIHRPVQWNHAWPFNRGGEFHIVEDLLVDEGEVLAGLAQTD